MTFLPVPPTRCASDGDLPGVLRPYNGHDRWESGSPGVSKPRHLPPSAFHTPSTVCSSRRLPALFRPVPFLGFTLQSLAHSREAVRLSAPVPSCRSLKPRSSTLRFSGRSRFIATSGSCSSRRCRAPRNCRPAVGPLLSWVSIPPGLSPIRLGQRFRRPPSPHFSAAASPERRGIACAARCCSTVRSDELSPVRRPSWVFSPCLALGALLGHPDVPERPEGRPVRGGLPPSEREVA